MRRRTLLATVGTATGAVLAGCGDAGDGTTSPNGSNASQEAGGEGGTGTPEAASTPDEPATPDETTTPSDSGDAGTEAATDEGTSSTEGTSTPDEAGGDERNSMSYPSEYVDVRDVEYADNEGESKGPTVTGVVQNVSTEKLSLVEAKVWAYNGDDEEVGEALDDTTDLRPGETWEFECELWDTKADEVAYWKGQVDVSTY